MLASDPGFAGGLRDQHVATRNRESLERANTVSKGDLGDRPSGTRTQDLGIRRLLIGGVGLCRLAPLASVLNGISSGQRISSGRRPLRARSVPHVCLSGWNDARSTPARRAAGLNMRRWRFECRCGVLSRVVKIGSSTPEASPERHDVLLPPVGVVVLPAREVPEEGVAVGGCVTDYVHGGDDEPALE